MSGRRWRVLGRLTAKVYNRMIDVNSSSDDESTKTPSTGEGTGEGSGKGDTQRTDSTTEHSIGEASEQSPPKVGTTSKHDRSESDCYVPIKRRRSEHQAAIEH